MNLTRTFMVNMINFCWLVGHNWKEEDPTTSNGIVRQVRRCKNCHEVQARFVIEKYRYGVKWYKAKERYK